MIMMNLMFLEEMTLIFQKYTLGKSTWPNVSSLPSYSLSPSPSLLPPSLLRFESARDILSDKSHVRYMKGVGLDLINYDEYDDEYDDTYDSHNIGSLDQDNTDDMFTVKR